MKGRTMEKKQPDIPMAIADRLATAELVVSERTRIARVNMKPPRRGNALSEDQQAKVIAERRAKAKAGRKAAKVDKTQRRRGRRSKQRDTMPAD
jgi:hypothetical protein